MVGALCTTPACMSYGSLLQSLMAPANLSVDPCTNFDKFVCHGASAKFKQDKNVFSDLGGNVFQALQDIVESDFQMTPQNVSLFLKRDTSTDETLFNTVKNSYQACMDEAKIEAQGLAPLRSVVEQVTSKFPVANNTSEKMGNQSISDVLLYMTDISVSAFTSLEIRPDPFTPGLNTLAIEGASDEPESSIMRRSESPGGGEPMSPEAIAEVLKALMPGNVSDEETGRLGTAVADLSAALTDLFPPKDPADQFKGATNMRLAEAAKLSPIFGHEKILQAMAPDFSNNSNVTVFDPGAISGVSELVSNTPKSVVQAFLVYKVANSLAKHVLTPPEDSRQKRQLPKRQSGPEPPKGPRSRKCIDEIQNSGMTYALERPFLTAASVDASKPIVENMMATIKEQFVLSLATNTFMSADAKLQAENKTRRIIDVVGTSQSSPNQDDVEDIAAFYKGLNVTHNYFANVLSFRSWQNSFRFSQAGKPANRQSFNNLPSSLVQGAYSSDRNQILILAGIMQSPFFHPDLPEYTNFGALGTVLGHELTHGFDNNGRKIDPNGRLATWWNNETIAGFEDRSKCFVNQYSNFTVATPDGPRPINGTQTLGENIADAGGLHLAFDSWKRQQNVSEVTIPGLERFTPEQMFYIAYATLWCENASPEATAQRLQTDEHSPSSARIVAVTANSRGFKAAFNCPVKEPTCELW